MKVKKLLGVVLASAAVLSLTACGGGETATDDHIVKWVSFAPDVRDVKSVNDAVNEYTQEKIGETIEIMNFGTEFVEKLQLMVATGERVDLCFSASHRNFAGNVTKGFYMDMQPYFDEYGKDIKALYPDYAYVSGIVNGKMYALPTLKDFAYEHCASYTINTMNEMLDATGMKLEDIKELKDVEPLLAAFKTKYPKNFPVNIKGTQNFFPTLGYISVGDASMIGSMNIYRNDGKVVNPYIQEDAKEYYKMTRDWYLKGYIRTDVATAKASDTVGKTLISPTQMLPYQRETSNLTKSDDKKSGDFHLWEPWMTSTAGSMQSFPRTCQNPVGAMKFLNLLNTDKYLRNLVALGIEGKHWEKVAEDDDFHFRYAGGKTRDEMDYYSWPYTQGNVYLTMQIEGTPEDIYEKYQEFDDRALKAQQFGLTFNGENVKTLTSNVANVYNEFVPSLVTGAVDPDEYLPKFTAKLEAAGIDELIAEMQKQFDEWKASQK